MPPVPIQSKFPIKDRQRRRFDTADQQSTRYIHKICGSYVLGKGRLYVHLAGDSISFTHRSSALVLLHLIGTISFLFDRSGSTSLFFLGGNHTLARPGLFMSNFPMRRMFNSNTTTRRKSLFSLGSRCLIAGRIWARSAPFSEPALELLFPLLLCLLRLLEYVCICIIGVGSSSAGCARACWNCDEKSSRERGGGWTP